MPSRTFRYLFGMADQILRYRLHHLLPVEHFNESHLQRVDFLQVH